MERIDLFDRYISGHLSKEEKESLELRLSNDSDFASEFNAYLLCVNGIRKEAEQDNIEFYQAMKGLSRKELSEIIGKKAIPMSQEQLVEQLRGRFTSTADERNALSGVAALSNSSAEEDELEITETNTESSTDKTEQKSHHCRTARILTVVFIVLLLIVFIISLLL